MDNSKGESINNQSMGLPNFQNKDNCKIFSIFDILEKPASEMEHAVFIIENQSTTQAKTSKEYFQIKINSYLNGEQVKKVVQIIDISDYILLSEYKTQH